MHKIGTVGKGNIFVLFYMGMIGKQNGRTE